MSRAMPWRVLAAFLAAIFVSVAHAGGPESVCYNKPIKYPGSGTVALNYDRGTLGALSKAQADAMVTNAVSLWTNVGTATVALTRGADLAVDVNTSNIGTYFNNWSDGLNPVIYDVDGSLVDLLVGVNAHFSVMGFAGSAYRDFGTYCEYAEGQAVLNGYFATDPTMPNVVTHEVGHLIGLDHTQINGAQGLATSNYPMMYPIAYRSTASLHEDDAAAISALYPDTTTGGAYGEITGTFTQTNGVAIQGANIWAQGTGGTFSIVSDYLGQGTGYFRLLLPPGTYTLHAGAISTSFTAGSSVGPYADNSSGASFQPPLYVNGIAMSPVTLGGGAPTQVSITAGCSASVAFRLDGSGTVYGNCAGAVPSKMLSPVPGSTLTSASATFSWDAGTGVTDRFLTIGTTPGGSDLYSGYQGMALSTTISGLPTNGATLYVRLSSWFSGSWHANSYTYTAANLAPPAVKSAITSPAPASTLTSSTVTFAWSAGSGVTDRFLSVGTSLGGAQVYGGYQGAALSRTVSGLPTTGGAVYVRLSSWINGSWQWYDYAYTAANSGAGAAPAPSAMTSPSSGSTLASSSITFTWNSGSGVTDRYLSVGTTPGGYDVYSAYEGAALSQVVAGLPTNGGTVYVRLSSWINGGWQGNSYTYTAANTGVAAPAASSMVSPAAGSKLAGSTVTFTWDAGSAVTDRYLSVGTTLGGSDLYSGYQGAALSRTITGLPTNGAKVYVQLSSWINGAWRSNAYSYTAFGP